MFLLNVDELRWTHPAANESTPAGRQRHTAVLVQSKKLFIFGVRRIRRGARPGACKSEGSSFLLSAVFSPSHLSCSTSLDPPLQGFDGYKWLSDIHVLDVGKLEEGAITNAR